MKTLITIILVGILVASCNSVDWSMLKVEKVDCKEKYAIVRCPLPDIPERYHLLIQDFVSTGPGLLDVLVLMQEYGDHSKTWYGRAAQRK